MSMSYRAMAILNRLTGLGKFKFQEIKFKLHSNISLCKHLYKFQIQ